jgi:hypothetical protein
VSRARRNKLAGLILVVTSRRRAYNRRGLKGKLSDVNIRGQQTISQLIVSDQLSFDYSNNSTKSKDYLVPELITVVFRA